MMHFQSSGILPCFLCFIAGVLGQQNAGSFDCQPSPWINGQLFTIILRIDRTKFPSLCTLGTNGLPSFEGSYDGGTYQSNCTVSSDIRSPGACSFMSGTLGCGCTSSDDNGFYVMEYNFIAGPDYYRWWRATLVCIENVNFDQAISFSGACVQPEVTTTTTVSTVTPPTTVTAALDQDNAGSIQCSPSPGTYGSPFQITLRIDRSKFPSLCTFSTNGKPYFEGSSDGANYKSNCTVSSDIRTACSFTPGTLGCGCTNSDVNGFYVIEYNFIAGPDYYRYWRANVGCIENVTYGQAISFSGRCEQYELSF